MQRHWTKNKAKLRLANSRRKATNDLKKRHKEAAARQVTSEAQMAGRADRSKTRVNMILKREYNPALGDRIISPTVHENDRIYAAAAKAAVVSDVEMGKLTRAIGMAMVAKLMNGGGN